MWFLWVLSNHTIYARKPVCIDDKMGKTREGKRQDHNQVSIISLFHVVYDQW